MKYTFVNAAGKQQTVNIPDDYIKANRAALGISNKEAIEMYLSDEGYIENAVVAELTDKAKGTGIKAKGARKAPARKPDDTKRAIIASLFESVSRETFNGIEVENAAVRNPERIISFSLGEDNYEIILQKKRK